MLQAFTKRFCLLTVVMLLSVVNALAQETAYGGGALPAAPVINGDVWDVTAQNAQYVLDGAYGSIDGKTINFTESISETLEFGRPTKYVGSNSKYYRHAFGTDQRTLDFMKDNQGKVVDGDYSNYYTRSISNVKFTADKGVTLNGFHTHAGGHAYGANVYDCVIDYLHENEGSVYFFAIAINGVTFDGITFTGRVNNEVSSADGGAEMRNFTFKNCTFNIGFTTDGNQGIRHYSEDKVNNIVSNLVVENCEFNTVFQGVYTGHVKNITVDGCTFNTTGHNAVAVQNGGVYNHGNVVITDNTGTNIGDRAIRLNEVGSNTQFTITGNNFTIAEGKSEEWIKATSLAEGITYNVADNTWTNFKDAYNEEFRTQTTYVAQIDNEKYETLQAAFNAAQDGDEVTLLADYDATGETNTYETLRNLCVISSITINGAGHTLTVNKRGVAVKGLSSMVDVTFKDINIINAVNDGRCIDTRGNIRSLTIDNSVLSTPSQQPYNQTLTIGGNQSTAATVNITNSTIQTAGAGKAYYAIITFNPVNMTISNSTLKGWACIYAKGPDSSAGSAGSVFTINNGSTLVSKNEYSGTSNAFSAIVIADNNITVDIQDTEIDITATGDQKQGIVSFAPNTANSSIAIGEGTDITLTGDKAVLAFNTGNQGLSGRGRVAVSDGTCNKPIDEMYCAEGYIPTTLENGKYSVKEGSFVAQVGDEKYASLAAAFHASTNIKPNNTITLLCDVELTEILNLDLGVSEDRILDLGGFTLTGRTNLKSGGLFVKNGIVSNPDGQPLNVYGSATPVETTYSYLSIGNDVIINGAYGICVFGPEASSKAGYGAWVEMAGEINSTKGGIFVSGNLGNNIEGDMNNTVLILGTINDASAGVALNGNATVNVYDGAVITGNTAIAIKRGVLNVEGGIITSNGPRNYPADPNYNGTEMTGAGISMTNTYNNYGSMAVNISGGTITSANADALYKEDDTYTNAATFAVSGGIFTSEVPAEFCAAGYEPAPSDDAICPYTVKAIDYTIVDYNENGNTVTANKNTAIVGEEITLTISTANGYSLKSLSLNGGAQLSAVESDKDQRTFVMPAANVTISAEFVQNATESVETIEEATIKTDGEEHSTATITNVEIAQEGVKNVTVSAAIGSADVTEIAEGAFASLPNTVQTIDLSSTKVELSGEREDNDVLSAIPENVLVYLPSTSSVSGTNVVIKAAENKYTCESLFMEDQNDYSIPQPFTAETATLNRSFTANVASTLCLPYDVPAGNIKGKIYRFKSIDLSACTITMTEDADGLDANVPYIFMPNADTNSISVSSSASDIEVKMENPHTTQGNFTFVGVFEKKEFTETECQNGIYGYAGQNVNQFYKGQFVKVGFGSKVAGMRAYLVNNGVAGAPAAPGLNGAAAATSLPSRFNVQLQNANGETTEILSLDMETAEDGSPVYNLSGQRVNNAEKGIYIKNGKKVIIK